MTLDDLVFIDSTGYHYADYPSFLAWLTAEYQGIFGADVVLTPDSQDGQWLAIVSQALFQSTAKGAATYNSFSPVSAQGTGLSRNVKINGLNRRIPTNSTVDVTIVGVAFTAIANGVVQDTLSQKWDLPALVTIPSGGTIVVTATAQLPGAINAQASTVNSIFTPTRGWQTVDNVAAATPGQPVETDAELRIRQSISTANPSLTVLDGTIGGVANVSGVDAVRGYENDTGATDLNGLPAHSISIVVEGGDAMAIAEEIALHKTPGTQTYGTTTELVYDAHGMPLDIHFYRPTQVTITATITIAASPQYSADYTDMIAQAVADAINSGASSEQGFRIGGTVLITKLYAPAYLQGTAAGQTYDVVSLEIGKNADPQSDVNIPLLFNEIPICDVLVDVTVVVT